MWLLWLLWLLLIGSMMSTALIDAARAGALAVNVINDVWHGVVVVVGCCILCFVAVVVVDWLVRVMFWLLLS